ncbi:MAG: hypothetical protein V4736_12300, partial [Bdellovibrionota bacterium]
METKTATAPAFSQSYLSWDVLMMGGISIIVCLASWAFMDKSASLYTISNLAFALAFAVNHPHFLSSYILMYKDFRKNIFQKPRYFFSAIVVPVALAGVLIAAMAQHNIGLMGHIVTAMYFLVGWHYVKQVFGCVVVSSAQRKVYYKSWERKILLTNLISVWFMSSLGSHASSGTYDFYGIKHYSLQLPPWLLTATYWVVGFTFLVTAAMQLQKYIREGVKPSPPGVAAFVALYAWYLPTTSHPGFGYLIPFFHSLQYLSFVYLLKKNQVTAEISPLKDEAHRKAWVTKFGGFALWALVLGALAFEYIPKGLDNQQIIPAGVMGTAP